ncbi:MAG: hypothetical protein RLZ87_1073 [Armatimonadota bacterium]|jgi:hypothetical protein|nr:hypothetical protein [Fimbriimonadaceae bacterium]MCE2767420.1 hypothetical protein [Fimbriimonadaceae bacterium]MCX6341869.1 hypothetical protein [Fimbriimonadales bacterium]
MKKLLIAILPIMLIGCNVGNAPAGGSEEETKKVFDSQPFEAKVKFFMDSPMTPEDKKKKIEELYSKEGKQVPADLFNNMPGPAGAPVSTGPAR